MVQTGNAIWRADARRIAILPLALFASVALFNSGGRLIILIVAEAFAFAPVAVLSVAVAST